MNKLVSDPRAAIPFLRQNLPLSNLTSLTSPFLGLPATENYNVIYPPLQDVSFIPTGFPEINDVFTAGYNTGFQFNPITLPQPINPITLPQPNNLYNTGFQFNPITLPQPNNLYNTGFQFNPITLPQPNNLYNTGFQFNPVTTTPTYDPPITTTPTYDPPTTTNDTPTGNDFSKNKKELTGILKDKIGGGDLSQIEADVLLKMAILETDNMNTDYADGDNKSGLSYNATLYKANLDMYLRVKNGNLSESPEESPGDLEKFKKLHNDPKAATEFMIAALKLFQKTHGKEKGLDAFIIFHRGGSSAYDEFVSKKSMSAQYKDYYQAMIDNDIWGDLWDDTARKAPNVNAI
jgi:hypothetical protein